MPDGKLICMMSADTPTTVSPRQVGTHSLQTLGAALERDRLEHRLRTVTVAIDVLHQRASEPRRESGGLPKHLRRAIADFEAQVDAIHARLRHLAPERLGVSGFYKE